MTCFSGRLARILWGVAVTGVVLGYSAGDLSAQDRCVFDAESSDAATAPRLEAVATRPECEPWTRVLAAQVLVRVDRRLGVAVLIRLLTDPAMSRERGPIAETLARTGQSVALAPAIEFLKDPTTLRSQRWDVAVALRATGVPEAVAAADRYQPSGRQGTGNPESSVGAWVSAGLWGVSLLLVSVWSRAYRVTRRHRLAFAAAAVLGAHLCGWLAYMVVGFTLSFYAPPLVVMAALGLGTCLPLFVVLSAVRRAWGLVGVSPLAVAVGATVGLFLGCYVDDQVYWYTARKEADLLWRYLSPLQQAVAWSVPLVASYWPHHAVWASKPPD